MYTVVQPLDLVPEETQMHRDFFGDSYDIVKRYFCSHLKAMGLSVYVDPMFTDEVEWDKPSRKSLSTLIGATPWKHGDAIVRPAALLIDPDTGVGKSASSKHITITDICLRATQFALVVVFDQAFARATKKDKAVAMGEKLRALSKADDGCRGFYYQSHASFLFASRSQARLNGLQRRLRKDGLPADRLVA